MACLLECTMGLGTLEGGADYSFLSGRLWWRHIESRFSICKHPALPSRVASTKAQTRKGGPGSASLVVGPLFARGTQSYFSVYTLVGLA